MSGCHALCVCFFEGYGDPRDLHVLTHAFPTRRSSDLWREHRRESILVGLLSAGGGIGAYTYISYMQKYLFNSVGFDKATATNIIAVALLWRSEEHTSELQSLMRSSYAVFCLKKKNNNINNTEQNIRTTNIDTTH